MTLEQKRAEQNASLLEKQIKELDVINKKQKEEIVQLTEENKTAEEKNNEYTDTINYLTKNLAEAQNELEKILDAYEDLCTRHKKLEDELAETNEKHDIEVKALRKREADVLSEKQKLSTQFEKEQKLHQSELASKDQDIQSLQKELTLISSIRDKEKESRTRELNDAHDSLRKARTEILKLKSELSMAREEVTSLNGTVEKVKTELDLKIEELTEAKEKLRELLNNCTMLQKQLREITEQKEDLQAQLTEKEAEIESLDSQLQDQKNEFRGLKSEHKRTEDKLLYSEKTFMEVKAKFNAAESHKNKLAEEVHDLNSQLSTETIKTETVRAELDRVQSELVDSRKELTKAKTDSTAIQRQLKESNNTVNLLQRTLEKAHGTLREISEKHARMLLPILQDNTEIFGLELCDFSFPRTDHAHYSESLIEWLDSFKEFIGIVSEGLENAVQTAAVTKVELNKSKNNARELDDKLRLKMTEISALKARERELLGDKDVLNERIGDVEQQLAETLAENKLLQSTKTSLSEAEKELREDKERLNEELTELSAQKDKIQNDLKDWVATAENNAILINTLEHKIRQITSEKRDFELLLTRIYACIPNSEMQKVISEMVKTQRELHLALRDKATNEQNLQSALEELRESDKQGMSLAKQRVAQLESHGEKLKTQIDILKGKLAEYAVELKETEAKERTSYSRMGELSLTLDRSATKGSISKETEKKPSQRFLTHRAGLGETETDAFAHTLAKVKKSLSKYSGSAKERTYEDFE